MTKVDNLNELTDAIDSRNKEICTNNNSLLNLCIKGNRITDTAFSPFTIKATFYFITSSISIIFLKKKGFRFLKQIIQERINFIILDEKIKILYNCY